MNTQTELVRTMYCRNTYRKIQYNVKYTVEEVQFYEVLVGIIWFRLDSLLI